jgi:hypothetical protein
VQSSQARAEQIVAQIETDAEMTRREADQYVVDTLRTLEMELERYLTQVRNGIQTLQQPNQVAPEIVEEEMPD